MKQVRFFISIVFASLAAFTHAQSSPLVLAISSATLYPDDQRIVFTLSVKNNTDSAVYFLKPDQALFEYDVEPEIPAFKEIGAQRPYVFRIVTSADCGDTVYGNGGQPERELLSLPTEQLIKLHPEEARIFVGLTATFDRPFCEGEDYTLQLFYRVMLSDEAVNSKNKVLLKRSALFAAKSNVAKLRLP